MPRAEPNRIADSVIFVRLKGEQRKEIEAAITHLLKDVPGAKMPLSTFMVQAALKEAEAIRRRR